MAASKEQLGSHELSHIPDEGWDRGGDPLDGRRKQFSQQNIDDGAEADWKSQIEDDHCNERQVVHPFIWSLSVLIHQREADSQNSHCKGHSKATKNEQNFAAHLVCGVEWNASTWSLTNDNYFSISVVLFQITFWIEISKKHFIWPSSKILLCVKFESIELKGCFWQDSDKIPKNYRNCPFKSPTITQPCKPWDILSNKW